MISFICAYTDTKSDKDYIVKLYLQYERLMFAVAKHTAQDLPSSWEDIVQDSLAKLIKHIDTLRSMEDQAILAYITITVKNTAINYVRRQSIKQKNFTDFLEGGVDDVEPIAPTIEELLILKEERANLLDIWESLPKEDQVLLRGKYILKSTDQELAEQLGCKPGSIRMKLTRARRRALKLLLEKEGSPSDKT